MSFIEERTVISSKSLSLRDEAVSSGKSLEFQLVFTGMVLVVFGFWSVFAVQDAEEAIEGGFFNFLLSLAFDVPLRLGLGYGLSYFRLITVYQEKYLELQIDVGPMELPKYNKAPLNDDTGQIFALNESADHMTHSIWTKALRRSPLKLSPIREDSPGSLENRIEELLLQLNEDSQRTIASHNNESLEEVFLSPQKF